MLRYFAVVLVIARVSCLSLSNTEQVCLGVDEDDWIHANNIELYEGCTKLVGNLRILTPTFDGDPWREIPPLEASALEALKDVRVVTGYVVIQSMDKGLTSLGFLRNLEIIEGKQTYGKKALEVFAKYLETLDLVSLREVQNGRVWIAGNQHLCLADTIDWSMITPDGHLVKKNRNARSCSKNGYMCAQECKSGCWGKGKHKCFKHDTNH